MNLKEFVETLDLTRYEKDALVFLGQVSSASAHEVYKGTSIPKGRIYSVLGSLADGGLAQVSPSKPKRFMVSDVKSRLKDFLSREEDDLKAKMRLIDELTIQRSKVIESPPSIRILSGRDEHVQGLLEFYRSAQNEILQCAPLFVGSSRSNRELLAAIKRGVVVRVLTLSVTKENSLTVQEIVRSGGLVRVLSSQDLLSSCIVDRREFLLGIQDYRANEERINLRSMNRAVLETLHEAFNKLWNHAIPIPAHSRRPKYI